MKRSTPLILGLVLLISLASLWIARTAPFQGADTVAVGAIREMRPGYEPWFESFWRPPSGEIESLLFAIQAALGAGLIGYYIGLAKGRTASPKVEGSDGSD